MAFGQLSQEDQIKMVNLFSSPDEEKNRMTLRQQIRSAGIFPAAGKIEMGIRNGIFVCKGGASMIVLLSEKGQRLWKEQHKSQTGTMAQSTSYILER